MTADNVLFEIKGLKKNFGDLEVLKGIHTTIRKGEVVVVIGPSGSGKSTFIRCLNLLETPTEGQIFFEGSCITDKGYAVHKHREKVGMVFQQFNLFNNLTILENVTISLKKVKKVPAPAAEEKARALLRRVGLEDKADAYPAQLSGGQKQRIAIAGVIAMRPRCIVLDEPTAMLDPRGRVEVLSTIREMNKQYGITVVLITHYMDEAAQCDRVVVVDDGKIILDGTAREVFTHVQLLKSRGLDVPQSTDLANDLADAGYSIDRSILGEEECADALAALLEAHGIHSTKQAEEA